MKEEESGPQNRELYALLHISPEASDEEIRKAYRQWAQIYHPDKYQALEMKEIATENFQRICEAYEILSDETKRQIYDIYGLEGINSGLELGTKLNKAEEIKEELERLRRQKELQKVAAHLRPSGSIMANLSLPRFLEGDGIMKGFSVCFYGRNFSLFSLFSLSLCGLLGRNQRLRRPEATRGPAPTGEPLSLSSPSSSEDDNNEQRAAAPAAQTNERRNPGEGKNSFQLLRRTHPSSPATSPEERRQCYILSPEID
ncbi:hypothetical protein H5410_043426 [Solanum commersonii]|uniref:J domain-containing protein n=1 Tax=Solanum commersonii TaxID=4109 RepID=A0A9J5Y080_SOLCO|nr:hypothetical protein H5410_043426 [Solanum commersonii]